MRALSLSTIGLVAVVAMMVLMPLSALSQPRATMPNQAFTSGVKEVGYRYRPYRYAPRPYYRPNAYRPYYRRYQYRPYYRPYYPPYRRRPQVSVWLGF